MDGGDQRAGAVRRARFEAASVGLPTWGAARPATCVYRGGVCGATQLFRWETDRGTIRQVTEEPHGVLHGMIDPDAKQLWWFALDASGETGRWRVAALAGGAPADALPGVPAGHPEGLALAAGGAFAVAISLFRRGTVLFVRSVSADITTRQYPYPVYAGGISPDGERVLLVHAQHGDPRRPALALLTAAGATVADLDHWPDGALNVLPYGSPFHPGDGRVLASFDRDGWRRPLLWDPASGDAEVVEAGLAGEVEATHAPGGELLLHRRHHGRSDVYLYRPGGEPRRIDLPSGTVQAAAARPDGDIWVLHSAWDRAPALLSARSGPLLAAPAAVPASHPFRDLWVPGPGGPVHALVTEPRDAGRPAACVFLLHGGPAHEDGDEYRPDVDAWADEGYTVVRVNYRGSSGYGTAWRRAHQAAVGHAELADVVAVRDHLVAAGIADPRRCVLAGGSWGGYLTLLGAGVHPDLWACAIAESPVADLVSAYHDRMDELQAVYRALFGGSPQEQPERYRVASPISYASQVAVPVMLIYGELDPRCPARQVEAYISALRARGAAVQVLRHCGGHGVAEAAGLAGQLGAQISFAATHARARARNGRADG